MLRLTWTDFDAAITAMVPLIPPGIHSVFGVPRGGMPLAVALSHRARLQYVTRPPIDPETRRGVLIVDDIMHVGETLNFLRKGVWYPGQPALVWYRRTSERSTLIDSIVAAKDVQHVTEILGNEWLCFPWEDPDRAAAEEAAYAAGQRAFTR